MSLTLPEIQQISSDYSTGFRYFENVISAEEENDLLEFIRTLNFQPYVMRGQASRRGIIRFGVDYGPVGGSHHVVEPLPPQLIQLREICAAKANLNGSEFVASVVSEYKPGATIGWHSDMTMFGPVVFGVSLQGSCVLKLRPKGQRRKVFNITVEPRSLYVMEGEIRSDWEHSIPPVKMLRYSITFRTVLE
jgi:alkylated DNA repair protein (DNA oxidative demethylase)